MADTGGPSLVALAAAFKSLEVAAAHVRGVCEWVERLQERQAQLTDEELLRLWVFAEQARGLTDRVDRHAADIVRVLLAQFLEEGGRWPLTPEQEQEYNEVLATLASREADELAEKLGQLRATGRAVDERVQ